MKEWRGQGGWRSGKAREDGRLGRIGRIGRMEDGGPASSSSEDWKSEDV